MNLLQKRLKIEKNTVVVAHLAFDLSYYFRFIFTLTIFAPKRAISPLLFFLIRLGSGPICAQKISFLRRRHFAINKRIAVLVFGRGKTKKRY